MYNKNKRRLAAPAVKKFVEVALQVVQPAAIKKILKFMIANRR